MREYIGMFVLRDVFINTQVVNYWRNILSEHFLGDSL